MTFYPQLSSGNLAQYPITKRLRQRVIENRLTDGSRIAQLGLSPLSNGWELNYSELSDAERELLCQFHSSMEGRLRTFAFLDPTGNLLKWSETLNTSVWTRDPGLGLDQNIAAPNGATRASRLTNSSAISQQFRQAVAVPGTFTYCFSVQARADVETTLTLQMSSGSTVTAIDAKVGSTWGRYWISGNLQVTSESLTFGLTVSANSSVEIFGLQATAQPGPGEYIKTLASSAVHNNVRFLDDALSFTSVGLDNNSMTTRLSTIATTG